MVFIRCSAVPLKQLQSDVHAAVKLQLLSLRLPSDVLEQNCCSMLDGRHVLKPMVIVCVHDSIVTKVMKVHLSVLFMPCRV